jgi:hypothetical protein
MIPGQGSDEDSETHPKATDDDSDEDNDEKMSEKDDSSEDDESQPAGDDEDKDEEMSEKDDSESGDETDEETDKESVYWRELIEKAALSMNLKFDDPKELLLEPILGEIVDNIRKQAEHYIEVSNYLEDTDKTYKTIINRSERYLKDGYNDEDALVTAWHECKFVIRNHIAKNIDLFEDEDEEEMSE